MASSLDDVIGSLEAVADSHGLLSSFAAAQAGRTLLAALAPRECEGSRTAAAGILSNMRSVDARSRLFRGVVSLMGLDEALDASLLAVLSSYQRPLLEALNAAAVETDPDDLDHDFLFETISATGVVAAAIELSEEDASTALFFLSVVEPLIARLGERVKGFGLPLDADTNADADAEAIDSRHVGLRLILDCAALLIVRRLALAAGGGGGRRQDDGDGPRAHDLLAAEDLAATATARPGTCYLLGCRVLQALIDEIQGRKAEYPS